MRFHHPTSRRGVGSTDSRLIRSDRLDESELKVDDGELRGASSKMVDVDEDLYLASLTVEPYLTPTRLGE